MPPRPAARRDRGVPTRRRLDLEARRAQLVGLGLDAFSSRPYDEVSVEEIARAAGISKGLLFHYFPSKRAFYVAAMRESARQLVASTLERALPTPGGPLAMLREGLDAYLEYVERRGPAYVALLRGGVGSDPEIARLVDDTRRLFADRILEQLPLTHPGLRTYVVGFLGFVEATSVDWLQRSTMTRRAMRDLLVETGRALVEHLVKVVQHHETTT